MFNIGSITTISNSTFSGNSVNSSGPAVGNGGGIYHSGGSIASISGSTFSENSAVNTGVATGGALYVRANISEISNGTFSGNTADSSGAAIHIEGASTTITTLKNSTFSANDAAQDSGIANLGATRPLPNFINNLFSGGSNVHCITTGWGSINASNNLSDGTCPGTNIGAVTNFDPTLKDNGGPTFTHALLAGSNAIDAGDNNVCPTLDQRGYARSDDNCDIGAYEYDSPGAPPSIPINPIPADTATGQSITADLNWGDGGGAASYDVYFGTNATPGINEARVNQTGTTYDPATLKYSTTYYWRIDSINITGKTTGNVWEFITEDAPAGFPLPATNPTPADEATNQPINTDVSWNDGGGATSYDVYFGANPNPNADEFKGNQAGMTFDPGNLNPDTTYYWRIDAKNSSGTIVGEIWQFTTGAGGEALFFPIKSKDGNVVVIYLE